MRIKGLIFDFDGTVADTIHVSNQAMQSVFKAVTGTELSDEAVLSYTGPTEEQFISRLLPDVPNAAGLYLEEFSRLHRQCRKPFDGITQLIKTARKEGLPVSMVTAKGPTTAKLSFDYIDIRHLFDEVYTATSDGIQKVPHIRKLIAQWGLSTGEAAYIGDTVSDMAQAEEAGAVPLGACWGGFASKTQLVEAGAREVFTDPLQILDWLRE